VGSENVVVVLGSPDPESTEIYAETVVKGDPTYAGALTNANLRLPVFHVLEPEVKAAVDGDLYEEQVGLMAEVLETDSITAAVRRVREGADA
jgi:betaine reductase